MISLVACNPIVGRGTLQDHLVVVVCFFALFRIEILTVLRLFADRPAKSVRNERPNASEYVKKTVCCGLISAV